MLRLANSYSPYSEPVYRLLCPEAGGRPLYAHYVKHHEEEWIHSNKTNKQTYAQMNQIKGNKLHKQTTLNTIAFAREHLLHTYKVFKLLLLILIAQTR